MSLDLNGALAAAFDSTTGRIRINNASETAGLTSHVLNDANEVGKAIDGTELKVVFV